MAGKRKKKLAVFISSWDLLRGAEELTEELVRIADLENDWISYASYPKNLP
jgi:hypothetical protein